MREAPTLAQLEAAKNGNEAELAAIIAYEMPVIRRIAHKVVSPGLDFDDAVQEGLIGLFSAIEHYRTEQSAAFPTYAAVCIQNAIYSAKKAASRKKHAPLNQSVPLQDEQSIPGPEEQAIAKEQVSATLTKAHTMLSPMEKSVLSYYLEGFSYRQIAEKIGKEEKAVENALSRIRRKLK